VECKAVAAEKARRFIAFRKQSTGRVLQYILAGKTWWLLDAVVYLFLLNRTLIFTDIPEDRKCAAIHLQQSVLHRF
jgi:hypothetical protein